MTLRYLEDLTEVPLTPAMRAEAERKLGVRLPCAYVDDLMVCNGGLSEHSFFPTSFPTTWRSAGGFEIRGVLGLGDRWGMDRDLGGALYLNREWEYPDGCLTFCRTPSAGHDTVMFDYRECGPEGEPGVVYYDCENDDPGPYLVARSYAEFMNGLQDPPYVPSFP